jgi:TRAP-type uncharacterized transport system substrate-binding protein
VRFAEDAKLNDLEGISCGSSGSSSDDDGTRVLSAAEITASKVEIQHRIQVSTAASSATSPFVFTTLNPFQTDGA